MNEEEETNQNLSMQKVLLPGYDPGWNDPPKWAYSGTQNSITPTKRVLNKRVAFPLASTKTADKESLPQNKSLNMPPPIQSSLNLATASHPPLFHPSQKDVELKVAQIEINKEKALNDVLANFEAVINEHILEQNRAEEVRKRLNILKDAWLEDKLNNIIYKNIIDLSTALREGNVEKADQIHVALMMQYASLCSSWIPGIRHVILELKTKMQSSSVIESQSESHLLLIKGSN